MMKKEEYISNSYSVQVVKLVKLILRIKWIVSRILDNAEIIIKNYNDPTKKEEVDKCKNLIVDYEEKLSSLSIKLEDSVTKIIALSHPVAFDLRFILASLKVSWELKYIAGWVKKSIRALERISGQIPENVQQELIQMGNISFRILKEVISVLLTFDSKKKVSLETLEMLDDMIGKDKIVDELYRKVLVSGIDLIRSAKQDPILTFEIIGIAKNFEKVADCVNNIIVTTRYVITGKRI
jgi:phosphate uptake regulator